MNDALDSLESQIGKTRDYESPPLHLWHPPLSGDIAIRIASDGTWLHENSVIKRNALVKLFASILRREEDGDYYLVSPHEKWRIQVDLHPLIVTDFDWLEESGQRLLVATLNTDKQWIVSAEHPLHFDDVAGAVTIAISHGLTALSNRAAWYRLIEMADLEEHHAVLRSGRFELRIPMK